MGTSDIKFSKEAVTRFMLLELEIDVKLEITSNLGNEWNVSGENSKQEL